MATPMDNEDTTPFADRLAEVTADAAFLMAGQVALDAAMADMQRRFRARVLGWGRKRGFGERDSRLLRETEGAEVSIPIHEVTAETATIYGRTTRAPLALRLQAEPHGFLSALTNRLRRDLVRTDDDAFDRRYRTVSTDRALGRRLLDARCLAALTAASAWCRVSYDHGDIAVRVEAQRLAGCHLLEAEAVAVALARVDVDATPYR